MVEKILPNHQPAKRFIIIRGGSQWGLFYRNNCFITNYHFFVRGVDEILEDGEPFMIQDGVTMYRQVFERDRLVIVPGDKNNCRPDVAMYRCTERVPSFPNLSKQFFSDDDFPVSTTRGLETGRRHNMECGKVSFTRFESGTIKDEDGVTRPVLNLDRLIMDDVSKPGLCGLPLVDANIDTGQPTILGINCGSCKVRDRKGLHGSATLLTRDLLDSMFEAYDDEPTVIEEASELHLGGEKLFAKEDVTHEGFLPPDKVPRINFNTQFDQGQSFQFTSLRC